MAAAIIKAAAAISLAQQRSIMAGISRSGGKRKYRWQRQTA